MNIIILKIVQAVVALSILIIVHEFGHFFFAKLFNIKVDKFFLFFDVRGIKILSTKEGWFAKIFPFLKNRETEYGIGWLPLGGYCKINGMIDESFDKNSCGTEPHPREFRAKNTVQRFLVLFGGVFFNFILAIVIYTSILGIWGEEIIKTSENKIYTNELSREIGFRDGDKILKLDDFVPEKFPDIQVRLIRNKVKKATVLRNGDTINIYIDHSRMADMLSRPMFEIAIEAVVDSVSDFSANKNIISKGDKIVAVGDCKIQYLQDFKKEIVKFKGNRIPVSIERNNSIIKTDISIDSTGKAGFYFKGPEFEHKDYKGLEVIPAGLKMTYNSITGYLNDLKLIANPETGAYKSVGSFISIGNIFPGSWNWYGFLYILAMLSVMLGVMNLLPIPALDGGHIMFVLYEMITGKKPGEKVLVTAQMAGMIVLFAIMLFACGNDIIKILK